MQQTTRTGTRRSTGPLADAGPYDYDLPVAHGAAGQPAPASRPAATTVGESVRYGFVILFVSIAAPALNDATELPLLHCYLLLYGVAHILKYWETPRPREGFLRWALKVVGFFLNLFVALVTVPQSLRGLLPDFWAFALPSLAFMLAVYRVPPLFQTSRTPKLWQWLLWSAGFAVLNGFYGPSLVK